MTTNQVGTVVLPYLGESITEATITRWLKTPGDHVASGEPLLEVAADKVDTEILSTSTGILLDILAPEGTLAQVGAAIGAIEQTIRIPPEPIPVQKTALEVAPTSGSSLSSAEPTGSRDRVEKLPRIRRTIATRMLESLQSSAQLTTVVEVDVTAIAQLRSREKLDFHRSTGVKLSFLPFFAAAAVGALADHPVINSSLNAECTEVTYHGAVQLGMAVDSEKGLMVPVIRASDGMGVRDLACAIAEAADKVRSGKIRADDLSGGTFTITNTGSRGALFDTPIINQPQSAILGLGAVIERLVPARGAHGSLQIEVRSMAYLSLSYDHRIVDGADAARYLSAIQQRLGAGFSAPDLQ